MSTKTRVSVGMPYPTSPPHHGSNGAQQPHQAQRYEYRPPGEAAPGQGQPYADWREGGDQPHRYPPPGEWRPPSGHGNGQSQQGEERFQLAPLYQSAYRQPSGYYHPHGHQHSRSSSAISQPYRDDMRPSSSHSQQMIIHKTEAPSPAKPLTEDEGPPGLRPKKKRRLALSCAQCAKRKQKCNRETPCQHCVARKVPELCVPYSRGPTPPPSANPPPPAPTMSARMNKVETLLNAIVELVPGIEKRSEMTLWRSLHPPKSAHSNQNEETDQERRRSTSTPPRTSISDDAQPAQPTPAAAMEPEDVEAEKVFLGGLDLNSGSRNPLPESLKPPTQRVELTLDSHGTPDENLRRLFNECGVHPYRVTEIIQDLPPKQFADRLISWFFAKVNFVRYPIDERLFRNSYEDVYRKAHSMDSTMVLALPLIFIVLAIAVRLAPSDWAGPDQTRKASSLRLYWTTRLAITISVSIKSESLQLVEARILSAMYLVLIHERRLAEGWSEIGTAIRVAQALGLHRDGTKLGLGVFETEYRRRIWSYLLHADRTYSCLLGRPSSIDDACCDTLPPTNIEISMLEKNIAVPARPLTEPTFATYLLLRQGLAKILGKVVLHFQRLDVSAQYRDVELIDGELRDFVRNLPPHFSMRNPDKSLDSALWYLPVHRYYIQTEILHFSIILHRPWLLRKLRNNRYSLSRNTCFESAVTDFKIRRAFKVECPNFIETLVGGSFREFNVAMIAGISVIIDPRGPLSKDMRMILQSFLEQHPVDQSLDLDDFSQKEASIIYTLNRRGQEMAEAKRSPQGIPLSRHPWHTSTSFERGSAASNKPSQMSQSRGGPAGSPNSASSNTPVQETAFLSPVQTSNGIMGPPMQISPNTIPSPEDDMPQRLFDYWLTNTAVPGSQSHVAGQAPIPSQSNIGVRSHSGLTPVMPGLGNGSLQYIVPQTVQGAEMPIWTEPPSASFIPPGVPPPANVQNSSEFWNSLIDGIVGTMPGGDSLMHENV